jgi:epoxyqueuosine reductase
LQSGHATGTEERLAERLKSYALEAGFEAAGICTLQPSDHATFYRAWLDAGYHGDMSYLARPDAVAARRDPAAAFAGLRSALVVALHYDAVADASPDDSARAVIARYARGRDYHRVMKKKLFELLHRIEQETARAQGLARVYIDTGPVLERELARRAGIGWFGKNTMLLHPKRGSYFFLGSLLLELDLEADAPFEKDHCGSCRACLDACPTGALLGRDASGAPVMDARLCISYLTIENRGPIPRELRPLIGNRVFGCDICQEVCPWNSPKFVQLTRERDFAPRAHVVDRSLVDLMGMSEEEWDEFSRGSAIRRAKRSGFLRNVAVALGNCGWPAAVPALAAALSDPEPLVRGHAAWALGEVGSAEALETLECRVASEDDPFVLSELEAALARSRPNEKALRGHHAEALEPRSHGETVVQRDQHMSLWRARPGEGGREL